MPHRFLDEMELLDVPGNGGLAVIEEADITFDEGFNALTGETGAGKSIVIDAMGAVLGQRTSRDLIRTLIWKVRLSMRRSFSASSICRDFSFFRVTSMAS